MLALLQAQQIALGVLVDLINQSAAANALGKTGFGSRRISTFA